MLTETETMNRLMAAKMGSTIFVAYEAGNEPTPRAVREAQRAKASGFSRKHFVGKLTAVALNRDGRFYFTIKTEERDDETKGTQVAYRSFNPSVGGLRVLEILH